MKKSLLLAANFLLLACVCGCRLGRYELTEPLDGQAVEVKSGDRISVVLEENATTGYVWMWECDDDEVSFERETIAPDDDAPLCGAPRKIRIIIRVHRGFDEPAHVKLSYKRPWKGGGPPAREINILLHRKPEDDAPWK